MRPAKLLARLAKGVVELNFQERRGQAKPYQLRQLAILIRQYDLDIEESK